VLRGTLQVGDPVPSESQLCNTWGVSRGPVRQALATLRTEGIIGGGPGKPPVVRARNLSQSFETVVSFTKRVTGLGIGTDLSRARHIIDVVAADPSDADLLGVGIGPAFAPLSVGTLRCSSTSARSPAPRASAATGTRPPAATRFGSSNTAPHTARVWESCIYEMPFRAGRIES